MRLIDARFLLPIVTKPWISRMTLRGDNLYQISPKSSEAPLGMTVAEAIWKNLALARQALF
jgi:hypothetical protein